MNTNERLNYLNDLCIRIDNGEDVTGEGFLIPIDRMEENPDDDRYYRVVSKPTTVRGVECRVSSDWYTWQDFELRFKYHGQLEEYFDYCIDNMVVGEYTVYRADVDPATHRIKNLFCEDFGTIEAEVAQSFIIDEMVSLKGGDD